MSCARWITCPPLYSVEAIEASVEASVEASIEVASRLSVEAASRRRGQGPERGAARFGHVDCVGHVLAICWPRPTFCSHLLLYTRFGGGTDPLRRRDLHGGIEKP